MLESNALLLCCLRITVTKKKFASGPSPFSHVISLSFSRSGGLYCVTSATLSGSIPKFRLITKICSASNQLLVALAISFRIKLLASSGSSPFSQVITLSFSRLGIYILRTSATLSGSTPTFHLNENPDTQSSIAGCIDGRCCYLPPHKTPSFLRI